MVTFSPITSTTAPIIRPTWRKWRRTRKLVNGGPSPTRCSSRSRPVAKASGGPGCKRSSIRIDAHMADGLLAGKVILITGGADGIGRECALAYACEGAHVTIADINVDKAEQTAAELAREGLALFCDVADPASVQKAIESTVHHFDVLDAVHNNA